MSDFNYWEFLAGLGIFLLGMGQMEGALKELAGKSFRNLLQKFTNKPWKGILVGSGITAILQSSSLVTLMVLAFLGAGILNLHHAMGVILGANLGTTITAWIVATFGFKISIAAISFPFIGFGSLMTVFFAQRTILRNLGLFMLGFGFLFFGIELMKGSIEEIANQVAIERFREVSLIVFLIIGILLTALIQSSSATLVILLSAINAQVIGLEQAAAATIGANIGTTITVVLGALAGTPDKKRLALLHSLFNVISGLLVFIFLHQIMDWILSQEIGKDPLIDLVLFNTFLNLFGILLFYPFLRPLEKWLKHQFVEERQVVTSYIQNVDIEIPEVAIKALEKELDQLYQKTRLYIKLNLGLEKPDHKDGFWSKVLGKPFEQIGLYNNMKAIEDEITAYHLKLQASSIKEEEAKQLTSIMLSLRLMIFAAKDFKDISHNLAELQKASRNLPKNFLKKVQSISTEVLQNIEQINQNPNTVLEVPQWLSGLESMADQLIEETYEDARTHKTDVPFSTLTNVTKEFLRGLYNLGAAVLHRQHPINEVIDQETLAKVSPKD
ncbi:MAG: Na/Pi cotransporter family protein [Bacteroidota bacterium]